VRSGSGPLWIASKISVSHSPKHFSSGQLLTQLNVMTDGFIGNLLPGDKLEAAYRYSASVSPQESQFISEI